MKKAFCFLAVFVVIATNGCRVRETTERDTGTRNMRSSSSDPFLSVNYTESNIARPELPAQKKQREKTYEQMDPMEQFFAQQQGFGNIMNNPQMAMAAAQTPLRGTPSQQAPPVQQPAPTQPAYNQPTYTQPSYNQPAYTQPPRSSYMAAMPAPQGNLPVYPITAGAESSVMSSTNDSLPQHVSLIYPSPEYGIIKLDKIMAREAQLGQPYSYSIVISNLTNTTLANVILTEELGLHFNLGNANPPAHQTERRLVWMLETLGPKGSERFEINGVPTEMEPMKHNTSVTYAVQTTSNIRIVKPKLELARQVPAEALLCDIIPVEYNVQNTGTGAARDVQIQEILPDGLQTENGKTEIVFDVGTLLSGQSRSFTAHLRATRKGVYPNKAKAVSSSNVQAESVATATSVRQPVLEVTKNGPTKLYLGRPASYEITVINKGDGEARDTVLEDMLPPGVTGVEASAGADITGSKLLWKLGSIPGGMAKTVRITYKPSTTGVLNSTASVTAYCAEAISTSATTEVVGIPAVRMDVQDLEDPIEIGGVVTYIITIINEGSAADRNIRLVCNLEDQLEYISTSGPTQGTVMGHTVTLGALRHLEPNEKASWRIQARAAKPGGVRFRVTLSSDQLTRPVEQTEATYLYE